MNLTTISQLAAELVAEIAHGCDRISIKGSIARGKAEPGDIDIVAIPHLEQRHALTLFGDEFETISILDKALAELYLNGKWQLDQIHRADGEKMKRLRHIETGTACDLYITDLAHWGMIATIRTGSEQFNKALMEYAERRGFVSDKGTLYRANRDGSRTPIPTPEEPDVFSALGLPWIEPCDRTPDVFRVLKV